VTYALASGTTPGMWFRWLVTLILGTAIAGCSNKADAPLPTPAADQERFAARGTIVKVSDKVLDIQHEAIAAVRDFEGKLSPMESMTMQFHATAQVPIAGYAVGDVVAFEFTVHYKEPPTLRLTKLEKLPSGTKLELP
jgi:Cu/Ag efflux protein CusF